MAARTVTIRIWRDDGPARVRVTGKPVTIAGIVPAVVHRDWRPSEGWKVSEPRSGMCLSRGGWPTARLALESSELHVGWAGPERMAELIEQAIAERPL